MSDDIDLEAGKNPQPSSSSPAANSGPKSPESPNGAKPKQDANPSSNGSKLKQDAIPSSSADGKRTSSDKLKLFRDLVGIHPLPMKESGYKRPAPNVGTYKRLVEALSKRRVEYYVTASFINACLFGQIVVAAALTALGAAEGSHILITVFGAINTVIAGVMTYLKGQGLPDRLLEDANGLRRVREYLEQVERQLIAEDSTVDVEAEAKIIYDMYNKVRKNAEDNVSGNWKALDPTEAKEEATKLEKGKGSTKYQSIGEGSGSPPPGEPVAETDQDGSPKTDLK